MISLTTVVSQWLAYTAQCDEQKPFCANCVRQETICAYKSLKTSHECLSGSPVAIATASATPPFLEGQLVDETLPDGSPHVNRSINLNLQITQMQLIHHHITVTSKTLSHSTEAEHVMSTILVREAFKHTYLLYATLALSSLHLDYLGDPEKPSGYWLQHSEAYHEAALKAFRETVRDINSSNFKPILMFAGLIFPYTCFVSISRSSDVDQALENILSQMHLTRRIRPVLSACYEEMKSSELRHIIPSDIQQVAWETEESPTKTELTQLRKFSEVVHHVYPSDIVDAYAYAIRILELIFDVTERSSRPPSDALLKIWIHFVSDRYMELLSERQPGSLIIFAHFAVMIHRAEHYWYFQGVAEQVLRIAEHMVPTEWKSWLDWPKEQISNRPFKHASGLAVESPDT